MSVLPANICLMHALVPPAGILGDIQAAQQARAEEVHFSETAWLSLLGSSPALNSNGRLAHC